MSSIKEIILVFIGINLCTTAVVYIIKHNVVVWYFMIIACIIEIIVTKLEYDYLSKKNLHEKIINGEQMVMIELKDICKSFGDHVVLKNFSLKINKNEFIAIIGESGAGKTTILNMISMIDKPDSGSISINGENSFSKKDIQNLRRYVFGYIFQNYALIENDTVKENLLLSKKVSKEF